MLLEHARDACLTSLTELQGFIKALNERPEELDEFMNFQVFHTEQAANKVEVVKKASVVDDMYELLAIYDQKVPTHDQVKHDDLKEAAGAYMNALIGGKEFIADHKLDMINTLESTIADVNEELLALLGAMCGGIYIDQNADSEEVVAALEEHRARLKDLREMSVQFVEYQTLFGMHPDEFTNLELAEKECDGRYQVWKSLYDFTMLAQDWTMGTVLGEGGVPRLSAETIRREVDEYATKAYKVRRLADAYLC